MNSSQRRKQRRNTIRAFPIGTPVECWYSVYQDYKVRRHGRVIGKLAHDSIHIWSETSNAGIWARPKDLKIKG
jgi:hypothetical protein